jgi:putative two-component system response regulator
MKMKSVLVVEDEPECIELIRQSLGLKEIRIIPADSGEQALQILDQTKPDLILLDIIMPEMDGFEVCRRIKADPRNESIPIVFLSVLSDLTAENRGISLGAEMYLVKPFDPLTLGDILLRAMN